MWRWLDANLEVLVHRGFLYLPLLLDPDLHQELAALPMPPPPPAKEAHHPDSALPPAVLGVDDHRFALTVSVASLADNYAPIHPQEYEAQRRSLRECYSLTADLWGVALDKDLVTIIFHIMPYFLRRGGHQRRPAAGEGEVLDLIRRGLQPPRHFVLEARRFLDLRPLKEALARLESSPAEPPPLPSGLMPAAGVLAWCREVLEARLLAAERQRLLQEIQDRTDWAAAQEERLALLLYVAHRGSLELNGFGFTRMGKGRSYRIYKRTGPYALKDFYGRLYLFPDCRVAVTTAGRLRPVVVDSYKHPFLRGQGSGQAICLGADRQALPFSAPNAVQALEEGVNALLYGYDSRRRNGYHSLDALPGQGRLVAFDDHRIPADHPLIVSGQVAVTNRDT